MPITDRNITPGTRFAATYKKTLHHAEALMQGDRLMFRLETVEPVTDYKSLSAAGSAVMGGIACNGWRFWSIEGEMAPASETRAAAPAKANGKTKAVKVFYRSPNQKGLQPGQTRYFCNGCMAGFVSESDLPVEACPSGHRNDDPQLNGAPDAIDAAEGGHDLDVVGEAGGGNQ